MLAAGQTKRDRGSQIVSAGSATRIVFKGAQQVPLGSFCSNPDQRTAMRSVKRGSCSGVPRARDAPKGSLEPGSILVPPAAAQTPLGASLRTFSPDLGLIGIGSGARPNSSLCLSGPACSFRTAHKNWLRQVQPNLLFLSSREPLWGCQPGSERKTEASRRRIANSNTNEPRTATESQGVS